MEVLCDAMVLWNMEVLSDVMVSKELSLMYGCEIVGVFCTGK
jgi:hypothetical protein